MTSQFLVSDAKGPSESEFPMQPISVSYEHLSKSWYSPPPPPFLVIQIHVFILIPIDQQLFVRILALTIRYILR